MKETVLIVDDSEEQLEIHKHYLEEKYQVICCSSGPQAIALVHESIPDVILMDIEMPVMNGTETMVRIRALKNCFNLPIIGLTGRTAKQSVLNFISRGGSGYLAKPIGKEALIENVERFIEQERSRATQKRILIIDDDQESLYIMKNYLIHDYYVTTLKTSTQILDYLRKYTPDLILLDYYMTPFNGASVYNIIRKFEKTEHTPIVFVTGSTDSSVLLECTGLQPAGIILKPIQKDLFLKKIKDIFVKQSEQSFTQE